MLGDGDGDGDVDDAGLNLVPSNLPDGYSQADVAALVANFGPSGLPTSFGGGVDILATQRRYGLTCFASRRRCTGSRSPGDMTVTCLPFAEEIVNRTPCFPSIQ